jgi:hypothetical protein
MKLKDLFSVVVLRQSFLALLVLMVFLPLLFLNLRNDHDWGDDFAQYLEQAENISLGRPMAETGYIYNPEYPSLGPRAYPPGFPLMIAPVVARFGDDVLPYNYFTSIMLILLAMVSVLLFYKYTGWLAAILLSALIYYNPYIINLKAEIMADIPFALFFAIFLLSISREEVLKKQNWIFAGIIAGAAITTKTIGLVLPLSLIIYVTQRIIIARFSKISIRETMLAVKGHFYAALISTGIYFISYIIFMRGAVGGGYLNIFDFAKASEAIANNIYVYSEAIRLFFINPDSPLFWIGFPIASLFFAFFVTGIIHSFSKIPVLTDWITVTYIGLLLVYPYHHSGFRFLLPLAPLIIIYSLKTLQLLATPKSIKWVTSGVSVLILFTYLQVMPGYFVPEDKFEDGPYATHVTDAFAEIASVTSSESGIVFIKPRALARFSGRRAMSHHPLSTSMEIYNELQPLAPTHYLLYSGLPDPALEHYLRTNQNETRMIWRDEYFRLYQKIR